MVTAIARSVPVFALAILGLSLTCEARAQEPSGRAVEVLPDVVATRAGTARTLVALQPIFMGDRIQTGSNGQAQLLFADNTRLVVGAGSSLLIEKYLLQSASASTVSNFSVNALRGSFRFITGDSPKPSYAIKTPTATIGIRGTEFDLAVRPDGQTQFVLLSGAATVCGGGQCVEALSACTMIEVPRGGTPRAIVSEAERDRRLRADFPYVTDRVAAVRQDFRAAVGACADSRAKLDATIQFAVLPVAPPPAQLLRLAGRVPPPCGPVCRPYPSRLRGPGCRPSDASRAAACPCDPRPCGGPGRGSALASCRHSASAAFASRGHSASHPAWQSRQQ